MEYYNTMEYYITLKNKRASPISPLKELVQQGRQN